MNNFDFKEGEEKKEGCGLHFSPLLQEVSLTWLLGELCIFNGNIITSYRA